MHIMLFRQTACEERVKHMSIMPSVMLGVIADYDIASQQSKLISIPQIPPDLATQATNGCDIEIQPCAVNIVKQVL
jgi:hypothetical protein